MPPRAGILASIQVLRAVAAWSVVLGHYCLIFAVKEPTWWRRGLLTYGGVGVDVFFVVSGVVMTLSASDPAITVRQFAVRRIARIVPAYWLFTLVVAALVVRAPAVMLGHGYSDELLVRSLLFLPCQNPGGFGILPINTIGWSLNVEMVFYLVVAVALVAPVAQRWLWVVVGIAVVQKLLPSLGVISDFYASPILYEFLFGVAAAQLWQRGALRGSPLVFAGLVALALICLFQPPAPSGLVREIDDGVPAFLLVCGVLGLEPWLGRLRALVRLGDHSYSVYLIHPTILYLGWYLHRGHPGHGVAISWACFAAIAIGGALSFHVIERPAGRALGRWLGGANRRAAS